VAVAVFSLVINVLMLTTSVYLMQVFDRVLASHSLSTLFYLTLIASGAVLVIGLLSLIRSRILVRVGIWMDQALSGPVLSRSLENAVRGNSYRSEALRDLGGLRSFLGGGGILSLFDAPWVPVYLAFVYLIHPWLGHVALVGTLLLLVCAVLNHRLTDRPLKTANAEHAKGFARVDAAFRNAEVIDSMAMAPALVNVWTKLNQRVLHLQEDASDRASLVTSVSKLIRLMLQIAILAAGAVLVVFQDISAGGMVAASLIMSRALSPVEQAIGTWKHTASARESWRRLRRLVTQPPLHPDSMPLPRPRGQLTVEGVTYTPHGAAKPVLQKLTLEALPGEALAIIGPSAAGKSTLARLMVGIASPQEGSVRLDGADVFDIDRASFGRAVGYLPQDVELFPGTVRQNIARMAEGHPERVVAAAELAGVHEMILRMPKGYETEIGEAGCFLSGGQRQRIGLARAVYGQPVLVVLDEPNSSLDAAGEEALNAAVQALKAAGSTVVLIAHRPSLLAQVDKIAILNEGRLQAFGTRDAVLSQMKAQRPGAPAKTQVSVVR
jgi:ATP-binding cassette subfamily C protein/ATP-binding cassette subfamily C protein EexD